MEERIISVASDPADKVWWLHWFCQWIGLLQKSLLHPAKVGNRELEREAEVTVSSSLTTANPAYASKAKVPKVLPKQCQQRGTSVQSHSWEESLGFHIQPVNRLES